MAFACQHLERLTSLTLLAGTLRCDTGLHIGTGEQVAPGASDLPVAKDVSGRPFVPGSSLKGVLRSFAERIVNSLSAVEDPLDLDRFQQQFTSCWLHSESHYCLSTCRAYKEEFAHKREGNAFDGDREMTEWIRQHTCSVCQLFGSPYLAGRIWIKDAFLQAEMLPLELRSGVAIDRDRRGAATGLLFDLEVVSPASEFALYIRVENADRAELGLLFLLLDRLERGDLRLGGRGGAGLGSVDFERAHIAHLAADQANYRESLLDYLLDGEVRYLPDGDADALWQDCKEQFVARIQEGWGSA